MNEAARDTIRRTVVVRNVCDAAGHDGRGGAAPAPAVGPAGAAGAIGAAAVAVAPAERQISLSPMRTRVPPGTSSGSSRQRSMALSRKELMKMILMSKAHLSGEPM